MKKSAALILSLIIILGVAVNAAAIDSLDDTAYYLINTIDNPTVASVGGEWTVIGLARCGLDIDDAYFENYYANVQNYVKSKDGVLHSRKYTEYSRVIIALTAIGKNPEDVAGYNLVTPLLDYDKTIWQGINGSIWAIIALDSGNYGTQEIRDKYIARILECEKRSGGWSLSETEEIADADITAMALTALSNYQDRHDVKSAIDRAINVLSAMQNENGGYSAYNTKASESTAQVLTALSAIGISYKDTRFVKNGKTLVDNLYSFKQKDGSFSHTDETNIMATEQCFYALTAAKRFEENKTSLFDMSDAEKTNKLHSGLPGKNTDVEKTEIKFSGKTFSDVQGHENQKAIEELAKRGIINGMTENSFSPDNTMTRAEFAAITVRALGLSVKNLSVFNDVKPTDWYAEYVNTAYSYGLVKGISETEFNPDGTITLEQSSAMVCRASKLCGMENRLDNAAVRNILAEFTDYMTVSEWAKADVAFCFEKGILNKSEIEIKPHAAVKRCQIADMLYNLLKGAMLI